jgi:uncharacterized protein (TIGR03435 family)
VGCPSDPGRITCTNVTTSNLIAMAYVRSSYEFDGRVVGDYGPFADRYDIAVKVPEGATKEQIRLMWQNLLAERFKLKVHREPKEMQGYDLVVARGGPKMQQAAETPPPGDASPPSMTANGPVTIPHLGSDGFPELAPGPGRMMAMMGGKARWREAAATAEEIASMLSAQSRQPVIDATGLKGKYSFTLSWVAGLAENRAAIADASEPEGPTLIEAVQSQLGLRLEPKKVQVRILIVDHVEKPTEN